MAVSTLTAIPCEIVAGDTTIVLLGNSTYLATLWTLVVVLQRQGSSIKNLTATASGTSHLLTFSAADTAGLPPGKADVKLCFTEIATSQRVTVEGDPITILPNPTGTLAETEKQEDLRLAKATLKRIRENAAGMTGIMQTQTVLRALEQQRHEVDRLQAEVDIEASDMQIKPRRGIHSVSVL